MASKWRQLLPHFLVMLILYAVGVIFVAMVYESSFWISLAIALGIAFLYPPVTRALDIAPEPWQVD